MQIILAIGIPDDKVGGVKSRARHFFPVGCFNIAVLVACACGGDVSAQGTVIFHNRVVGTVVAHVYLPLPANPNFVQTGNGPSDFPSGTTDWTGWTPVSGAGF